MRIFLTAELETISKEKVASGLDHNAGAFNNHCRANRAMA